MLEELVEMSRSDPTNIDVVRKAEENLVGRIDAANGKLDALAATVGRSYASERTHMERIAYPTSELPILPDKAFYNLFVLDVDVAETGCFSVNKCDSIAKRHGVDADIIALFANFSDNDERILQMPSLFVRKNETFNRAGAAQAARLGEVTAIAKEGDSVKVIYRAAKVLHQQRLVECARELCIKAATAASELDTPHWSIKRFDLVTGLQIKGLI